VNLRKDRLSQRNITVIQYFIQHVSAYMAIIGYTIIKYFEENGVVHRRIRAHS